MRRKWRLVLAVEWRCCKGEQREGKPLKGLWGQGYGTLAQDKGDMWMQEARGNGNSRFLRGEAQGSAKLDMGTGHAVKSHRRLPEAQAVGMLGTGESGCSCTWVDSASIFTADAAAQGPRDVNPSWAGWGCLRGNGP